MNQESLLAQFEVLLPLAATWATEQERKILHEGIALSEQEVADAKAVGVKERQRVRLLQIETIARPSQPQLRSACDAIDFLTPATFVILWRDLKIAFQEIDQWQIWVCLSVRHGKRL